MLKLTAGAKPACWKESEMEDILKTHIDPVTTRLVAIFEKIWPLMRPAASTRLAWIVVCAGVTLLVQPFWEPIIIALASKYLAITVKDLPGPGWGLILIITALTYHYLVLRGQSLDQRLSSARIREHDKPIVERLTQAYPPQNLENLTYSIGSDHSYFLDENNLGEMARALRDPSNRFLDPQLAASAEALAVTASSLGLFLQTHFFVFGKWKRLRLALYPDLNEDRAETGYPTPEQRGRYEEHAKELHRLLDEVDAAREDFIVKSHQRLA
jgi:hypothetical protein